MLFPINKTQIMMKNISKDIFMTDPWYDRRKSDEDAVKVSNISMKKGGPSDFWQ